MLELELEDKPAILEAFKSKPEKMGGTKIPAAELMVSCSLDADVLAFFSPTLREHLFDTEGSKDLLGDVAQVRYPHLDYPLGLDNEMSGATVSIGYGIGSPMRFTEARLNQFGITPMNGGAVVVFFRVQCKPTEQQAGRLHMLNEQPITITIEPMELPTMKAAA